MDGVISQQEKNAFLGYKGLKMKHMFVVGTAGSYLCKYGNHLSMSSLKILLFKKLVMLCRLLRFFGFKPWLGTISGSINALIRRLYQARFPASTKTGFWALKDNTRYRPGTSGSV